ncbi:hypothetical protein ABCA12_0547 [Acinetobacter junii]|jgi:hypothetical protein|nr:hypothetical protein ABCA12_0547 [Acinetobacter junii]
MKVIKGTLAITLTALLAACGGNDGYYSKTESTNPPGGQTPLLCQNQSKQRLL